MPNFATLVEALTVTFHGVRGSTPCHGPDVARYGGNTSSVSIAVPGQGPLLLDLGTGVRYFGNAWPAEVPFVGTCLLSHLHWDHLQGLPFFAPLLRDDSSLTIYGPRQGDGRSIHAVLKETIRPPLFPVELDMLPGSVVGVDVADDDFMVGSIAVRSRHIPHIGPTVGYRVEWGGATVAYLSDHQQPIDGSFSVTSGALELVDGVDVLIHDAQYTPDEFACKASWGHCTIEYAVWLAQRAKAKTLVLFHHDPLRTDDALDSVAACAIAAGLSMGLGVVVAAEGLTMSVPAR